MNQLYQQITGARPLPQSPNNFNQIKGMMNAMRSAKNPEQFLMNMAQNNPKMQQVMGLLKGGKDPKTMFYEMAQQKGIDPDTIVQMLGLK